MSWVWSVLPVLRADRGAVSSEYAILAALIAVVIAAAVGAVGVATRDLFAPVLPALGG